MDPFDELIALVEKPLLKHTEDSFDSLIRVWQPLVEENCREEVEESWDVKLSDDRLDRLMRRLKAISDTEVCRVPVLASYPCSSELGYLSDERYGGGWAYSYFDSSHVPLRKVPLGANEDLLLELAADHIGFPNSSVAYVEGGREAAVIRTLSIVDLMCEEMPESFYLNAALFSREMVRPLIEALYRNAEIYELEKWNLSLTAEGWLRENTFLR